MIVGIRAKIDRIVRSNRIVRSIRRTMGRSMGGSVGCDIFAVILLSRQFHVDLLGIFFFFILIF